MSSVPGLTTSLPCDRLPGWLTFPCLAAKLVLGEATLPQGALAPKVDAFVRMAIDLCKPDRVYVCTGTEEEYSQLMRITVEAGAAKLLSSEVSAF